ncbi:hypothetical protein MyChFU_50540 [Mycobacterium intracellulare subsp. chimaera]
MNHVLSLDNAVESRDVVEPRRSRKRTLANGRHSTDRRQPAPATYSRPHALIGNTPVLRISAPPTTADRRSAAMKALGFDRPSRMLMTNRRQPGPLLARPLPGRRTARVNGHAGPSRGRNPAVRYGGPSGDAVRRPS